MAGHMIPQSIHKNHNKVTGIDLSPGWLAKLLAVSVVKMIPSSSLHSKRSLAGFRL